LPGRTSSIGADRENDGIWIYGLAGSFIIVNNINQITFDNSSTTSRSNLRRVHSSDRVACAAFGDSFFHIEFAESREQVTEIAQRYAAVPICE
jgi:hypothetical protein